MMAGTKSRAHSDSLSADIRISLLHHVTEHTSKQGKPMRFAISFLLGIGVLNL